MVDQAVYEKNINELFDTTAYELFEKIGEGGFGRVYRAKQLSTNQSVAIKFMSVSRDFDQATVNRYIDRFERETLLCSRLQHPNIVRLLDKGQNNGLFYAVYEYVEGKTLKQQLEQEGCINPLVASQIMAQVLDALAHAHEQGVIHRDIKPANIMLTKTGAKTHAKILDFGIGTLALEARQLDHKSITLTQETLGTPSYSAPEQLRGEPPTSKTDIYVWGLVFIECLTGKAAMGGSSLAAIFHKQLSQANVPLPAALAGHPVTSLLRRVLQKKAEERAANAAEIYHEFMQLNFATLVGDLTGNAKPTVKPATEKIVATSDDDATVITNHHISQTGLTERKQISALCVSLLIKAAEGSEINKEVADALHRDQIAECIDIAVRFGATHVATLASSMLFYFGYPTVSDNDGRLCARTALEIIHTIKKRNSLLKQTQGIESVVKIGMNTGLMTVYADAIPEGETANIASELAQLADNNQILITIDSKSLLETHLEFQPQMHRQIGLSHQQTACYSLIAERQVEAFGFLRGNKSKHQLIGREVELSQLMGLLADELHTESQCTHVFGEAGIGKSRLIFELRTQAQGFNQYVAQCLPEHKNNALYPILKVLRYKYSLDGLLPAEATDLLRRQLDLHHNLNTQDCLPILCSWLALPLPEQTSLVTHSPQMQKRLLFDTLTTLLLAQVSVFKQPNLFLFEDMHWADPTSLEFIAKLITSDNFTYSSDVFISTSRQALPEQFSDYAFAMVALHKLTQQQTQDFVQLLFDGKAISSQLFDTLVSRTDGIPLFIEEVVGMLKQKGLVRHQNGVTRFVSDDAIDQVPSSLRDSLQQKLDSLVYAKETAQLAATIGREFDYDLLVASSEQREEQIQIDLEELIQTELVYLQRKVKGDSYLFKHALVRDAAYESMLEPQRHQSHYRIAQSLESEDSEVVETTPFVVAQHYAGAEHFSKASQLGIRSVQKMVSSSANAAMPIS